MLRSLVFTLLLAWSAFTFAIDDINTLQNLSAQSTFKSFSEDVAAIASYKAVIPAEGLGTTGFDIGVELSGTKLEQANLWETAAGGQSFPDTLAIPKIHVHKGLPLKLDIGGFYAAAPGSNIKLLGAEIRYNLLSGNVALPAVAIRASRTELLGVDQLGFDTTGLDISVSKGLAMFTPYAGLGKVWANSEPKGTASGVFSEESLSLNKYFLGANFNMGLFNVAMEVDKTGDASSASLKLGYRF